MPTGEGAGDQEGGDADEGGSSEAITDQGEAQSSSMIVSEGNEKLLVTETPQNDATEENLISSGEESNIQADQSSSEQHPPSLSASEPTNNPINEPKPKSLPTIPSYTMTHALVFPSRVLYWSYSELFDLYSLLYLTLLL